MEIELVKPVLCNNSIWNHMCNISESHHPPGIFLPLLVNWEITKYVTALIVEGTFS